MTTTVQVQGKKKVESLPLSKRLRRETKVAHKLVEGTRLARAFFKGTLNEGSYAEGLARLYPVYATMESALSGLPFEHRLKAFDIRNVFRSEAILADLRYFGVAPEPFRDGASARYFERVQAIAGGDPTLLVAHAYVRYMADVSGGVIAGKIAQRALKLPTREGLSFLTFASIPDPAVFREDFRARLDRFPQSEEEAQAIVNEASLAFELNRELADELWAELYR